MKRIVIIGLLIIVGMGIGFAFRYQSQKKTKMVPADTPTVLVKQGEFVIGINDTGIVKAKRSSVALAPELHRNWNALKIAKLVPEGSKVMKNDPICWFDKTDIEKQIKDSEFNVKINESNLKNNLEAIRLQRENRSRAMKEKKLDWDSAKVELELETKKYEKVKRLVKEEILPQQDLENEERTHRSALLKVDSAEKEYLKAAEQQNSDEKMKEIDIQRTQNESSWYKNEYDQLKKDLENMVLLAPAEGIVVYEKNWRDNGLQPIKEGDQIWPEHSVAQIPDLREIQVMSQVFETDVSKVTIGMPVRIKMDAIPDLTMTGEISVIGNLAMERERSAGSGQVSTEESSGIKVFEITIDIDGTDTRLRPGMTCKVEMVQEKLPTALSIPLKAVHIEQGVKFVFIKKNGNEEKRIIILGKQNDKEVIVEKGLKVGEEVILPTDES